MQSLNHTIKNYPTVVVVILETAANVVIFVIIFDSVNLRCRQMQLCVVISFVSLAAWYYVAICYQSFRLWHAC